VAAQITPFGALRAAMRDPIGLAPYQRISRGRRPRSCHRR